MNLKRPIFPFLAYLLIWLSCQATVAQESQQMAFDLHQVPSTMTEAPVWLSPVQEITLSERPHHVSLAIHWETDQLATDVRLSYRVAGPEAIWQDWQDLHPELHADLPVHQAISELMLLDRAVTQLQIRVEWLAPETRLQTLQADLFAPGHAPLVREETPLRSTGALACPLPSYVSRAAWGCPDGDWAPTWWPAHNPTTHLVVHHTATGGSAPYDDEVLSIWNFHTNSNGWGDIGYNWLIAPDGTLYEGRAGGNHSQGAHMCARNGHTMGIGIIGNYSNSMPPDPALETLKALLAWRASLLDLDPNGSLFHGPANAVLPEIMGHRDGCPPGYTECPGDTFYTLLPRLRDSVMEEMGICPNPVASDGDVFLTSRSLSSSVVRRGQSLTVSSSAYYSHSVDSSIQVEVGYLLSNDCALDATDRWLGSDQVPLDGTAPEATVSTALSIPGDTDLGSYFLIFVADYPDSLAESDERNNIRCRPITIEDSLVSHLSLSGHADIKVYPNPFAQYLTLSWDHAQVSHWQLHDPMGRALAEGSLAPQHQSATLQWPELSAGLYYLTLLGTDTRAVFAIRKGGQ